MYSMSILNSKLTRGKFNISCLAVDEGAAITRTLKISSSTDALFILGLDRYFNFELINFLANNSAFSNLKGRIVIRPHPLDNINLTIVSAKFSQQNLLSKGGPLSSDLVSKKYAIYILQKHSPRS